ncbi:MAG: YifB family Mg chelatase-like AAA ATPase [Eubacteriales bacterium]
MVYPIYTLGLQGVTGHLVSVECDLSSGLPVFNLVGLPDAAVSEARERVRSAITNSNFVFPACRIIVNLAPSNIKKAGTFYDLPILISILCAGKQLQLPEEKYAFLGELSLGGELRPAAGILPMALAAKREGIKHLFVPKQNAREATLAQGPLVYGIESVTELVAHLFGEAILTPEPLWVPPRVDHSDMDFSQVKGQDSAKRALEIAAAGGHNLLMTGPPGSGKSMLAKRLTSILPDMTRQESLEATEIHSILGLTNHENPLITTRPFRAPHHTVSPMGLAGGGSNPRPGEISLSHHGVLFLDELPEFTKEVVEVLRQPIEDGIVQISRASGTATYPCDFMLICAMNPCRCGWYGDSSERCRCSPSSVEKYLGKISGPMLDRIDLFVKVTALTFQELSQRNGIDSQGESSSEIQKRVNQARAIQTERYSNQGINASMNEDALEKYATLNQDCSKLMEQAFLRFCLTGRSHSRIRRLARTIADLDGEEEIQTQHLSEALHYRPPDYLKR